MALTPLPLDLLRTMPHERLRPDLLVEAILDIRSASPSPLAEADLRDFVDGLERYPRIETIGGALGTEDGARLASDPGFLAFDPENRAVVQARASGFGYNHLTPYPGWDAFKAEAQALYAAFTKDFPSFVPATLGLSYINQLDLPADKVGERRIFKAWPWADDSLATRKPYRYYMRMDVPTNQIGIDAEVGHALETTDENTIRIIVENSLRARISPEAIASDQTLWHTLDGLHDAAHGLLRDTFTQEAFTTYLNTSA